MNVKDVLQPRRSPKRRCKGFRTPCDEGLRPYVPDGHIEECRRIGRHRCGKRPLADEFWCMDCYTLTK